MVLPAARLAHDCHRLAGVNVQADTVDSTNDTTRGEELRLQVLYLEDRFGQCFCIATHAGIERVAQPVTDEVERQHGHREGECKE